MGVALPVTLPDGPAAVTTRALIKRFGAHVALQSVDVSVPRGAVYLLVGPNGAGKSTLLKIVLDLTRASAGQVDVLGLHPAKDAAMVRANIGYVPERNDWSYGWMTVRQALQYHQAYYPAWDSEYAERLIVAFDLQLGQRVGTLSKGQGRRAHLVMAMAHRPPLLLLDEPTDGLDPVMRDETLGMLSAHLADTETTVLLSTHHVAEVEQLADHVGILAKGELRLQSSTHDIFAMLRRYKALVPGAWHDTVDFRGLVLRRSAPAREIEWTVWGAPVDVTAELERVGATVTRVVPLTLAEATLACLAVQEVQA